MIGLGTIINTAAVIVGGLIGLRAKGGLKKSIQEALMQACGVTVIFIGTAGALSKMLVIAAGQLETQGTMLLIFSLVIGAAIGEGLRVEQRMDALGEKIKAAVKAQEDTRFVDGFVNVTLITCVGAMAIVGSIQDGISGDYSLLLAKSILDMIITLIFAATCGIGAVFSAIPILLYQGLITIIAAGFGAFIGEQIVSDLSFVGSALIFCVGVNITFGKKFKVGNMLPALLVPIAYHVLLWLMGK